MELQNAVFKYLGLSPDIVDGVYREPKKPYPCRRMRYSALGSGQLSVHNRMSAETGAALSESIRILSDW